MTDAKPIEPSTERVANTVAFLLRFSDDYEDLRTKGPETPITEMLENENLTDDRKEKLFLKAHETIAEMDEAMQEPSVMDFFKGINLQEMAEKAKKAAEEAAGKLKEMGDKELTEFKKFVGDRYDSLSDEKKAQLLEAYEKGNKIYGDTKAAVGDAAKQGSQMASQAASSALSFLRGKTQKPSQGGKRKNKTKKLTKKEKKMKRARK